MVIGRLFFVNRRDFLCSSWFACCCLNQFVEEKQKISYLAGPNFHFRPPEKMISVPNGPTKQKKSIVLDLIKMNVAEEVPHLIEDIKRLGAPGPDGKYRVKFGVLFNDPKVENTYERFVLVASIIHTLLHAQHPT